MLGDPTIARLESPTFSCAPMFDVNTKAVLPSPHQLKAELPTTQEIQAFVDQNRSAIADIVRGQSHELLVLVGPCSIHDTNAALDYASRLKRMMERHKGLLRIVMRVYCEKPRSGAGWKGLIRDPFLDGSNDIGAGLYKTRQLLLQITAMGIPCGVEFLDPIVVEYISDVVSWGTIGARTAESQIHREVASGLPMPVGFKNATNGHVQGALDGVLVAARPQSYISVNSEGHVAVNCTKGNPNCHLVLRGGHGGPNFHAEAVAEALEVARKKFDGVYHHHHHHHHRQTAGRARHDDGKDLNAEGSSSCAAGAAPASTPSAASSFSSSATRKFPSVVIDCSHDNSGKDHRQQPAVVSCIAEQLISAPHRHNIAGVMLESFIEEGSQVLNPRPGSMEYGKSVTDGCINLATTAQVLGVLADAVQARRKRQREGGCDTP
jgi:3-deoxy-7-phosphoheptulonate synthase